MAATGKRDFTQGVAFSEVLEGHSEMDGSLSAPAAARNCRISYKAGPRTRAVATISRDLESLQAELDMERD